MDRLDRKFDKCCCCVGLDKGAQILGILSILSVITGVFDLLIYSNRP